MNEPSEEQRPPIPADIKRKVLVEAGHRCAIPTCRYIEVEIHHITPWASCKKHEYDNLIALCANCHRRADRGEIDRKSLRLYKVNLRFAHDKFSQIEIDTLFETKNATVPWPAPLMILLKRILEAQLIEITGGGGIYMNGVDMSPHFLRITPKGLHFIDDLGHEEY